MILKPVGTRQPVLVVVLASSNCVRSKANLSVFIAYNNLPQLLMSCGVVQSNWDVMEEVRWNENEVGFHIGGVEKPIQIKLGPL
jgi:hypothetical protein